MSKADANLLNLLKLLDDDSPKIQGIVNRQLLENAVELILRQSAYRSMLKAHQIRAFDATIERLHGEIVNEALQRLLRAVAEDIDLEKSLLVLNYWHNPGIDCGALRDRLDALGETILATIPKTGHPLAFLDHIGNLLFEQLNIERCQEYDTENSFLHQLFETGRGTPITVGILYILISKRLGAPIYGVPMPGHFILKFYNDEDEIFFDPFYGGRIYSREMCRRYLENNSVPNVAKILEGSSNVEIFVYVLKNLRTVFSHEPDKRRQTESFIELFEQHSISV